jgi:ABC-2 type transport system permease protein
MRYLTKRNRAILREMISADFKVRYQGSALGYLWSLLRPLFMFAILYVIFVYIFNLNKGVPHLGVYLLLGIVLWNFFHEATTIGMSAVVGNGDLLRKISIPRYLVVVACSASAFINLLLNMGVVIIFALVDGIRPDFGWLLALPLIAELFIFAAAVAFLLAALYVKFRDVTYIWEVLMQAAFYGTPILYAMTTAFTMVPAEFQRVLLLNPMAQIIQDVRHVLVTDTTITGWQIMPLRYALLPLLFVIGLTIVSVMYFKKESKNFAENI